VQFDLRTLEIFVHVVETGGMSRASQRLGLTQPAISQAISMLEKSLNTKLLDRSVRPIALTVVGRMFYEHAKQIVDKSIELAELVNEPGSAQLSKLRLGLVDSFAPVIGAKLVYSLMDIAKDWSVHSGLTAMHHQALLSREVDLVVIEDYYNEVDGLERHHLITEPYVIASPINFNKKPNSLKNLAEELPFLSYSTRSLTGAFVTRRVRQENIKNSRIIEFDNTDAMFSLISEGFGWTITIPMCFLQVIGCCDRIRLAPLPGQPASRSLSLVSRSHELGTIPPIVASSAISILRDYYMSEIQKHAKWAIDSISISKEFD